jgi:hypothetical protein
MTARDILRSDVGELVPAAEDKARKLPIRDRMPKNTTSLGKAAADALGVPSLSDDPLEIERLIKHGRN